MGRREGSSRFFEISPAHQPDRPLWRWLRGRPGERPSPGDCRVGTSKSALSPLPAPPPLFPPRAVVPEPEPRERALPAACPRLQLRLCVLDTPARGRLPGPQPRAGLGAPTWPRLEPGPPSLGVSRSLADPEEQASQSQPPGPRAPRGPRGGDSECWAGVASPRSRGSLICGC